MRRLARRDMQCSHFLIILCLWRVVHGILSENKRQKRYLIFTPATQYGVFATVSVPLSEPDNLVSMAWFFEANYYNVDNSSYFEPLLGDIEISRSREERGANRQQPMFTRTTLYTLIETMFKKHGYRGRSCLLRAICEGATTRYHHNGLLGDLFQLILMPSASLPEEELNDCYYKAEYYGLDGMCYSYRKWCPSNPLDKFSMYIDHLL